MMSDGNNTEFIVIDDDPINNMICSKFIQMMIPGSEIQTFTNPEKGIEHLAGHRIGDNNHTILFLDINMPSLTGWEVLKKVELFPDAIKEKLRIFMLSSSVDQQDKEQAANNPLVLGYISKPLSKDKLMAVINGQNMFN